MINVTIVNVRTKFLQSTFYTLIMKKKKKKQSHNTMVAFKLSVSNSNKSCSVETRSEDIHVTVATNYERLLSTFHNGR